jgi:hypothetical protein
LTINISDYEEDNNDELPAVATIVSQKGEETGDIQYVPAETILLNPVDQ